MAYNKVNWENLPSTNTPINTTNLGHMDDGIKANDDKLLGNTSMGNIQATGVSSSGNISATGTLTSGGNATIGGNLIVSDHILNKNMPSTNLNDATTNGTYMYDNGQTVHTNSPSNEGIHILNVLNNGGGDWVIQEDYDLRYGNSSVDKYVRLKTPGGWGNWQKII